MDLYATKASTNARLVPLVDALARRGVSPDALTLAAVPVALVGGACILFSPALPELLLAVPVCIVIRILLNLLDGNMARRTGRIHPRGELFNEVGDRLADIAFLAPVAFLPGAPSEPVLLGVLGGLLASYVGITARAAGGERIYRGALSKPGRMATLLVCSLWALAAPGSALPWTAFAVVLLVGTLLTVVERMAIAIRRLP
jgi:CDP-diacylglycerol--glycerol-3-phosphate 3-phosphatidyltransferase